MPRDIKLEELLLPGGIAMQSAFPGEQIVIQVSGFHSSAEGETFTRVVDSITAPYLTRLGIIPSQIDNLLILIKDEANATVYVNEITLMALVQARTSVEAGSPVRKSDFADIRSVDLGVEIPPDAAIIFVFSQGWRKGLFFDFSPFQPERQPRTLSLGVELAAAMSHVMFSERFTLSDLEWEDLFSKAWFPFIGLNDGTVQRMIEFVRTNVDLDKLLPEIESQMSEIGKQAIDLAQKSTEFQKHARFIETALDRLLAKDFVSAAHVLYPRIEGMLRTFYQCVTSAKRPKNSDLIETAFPPSLMARYSTSVLRVDQFSNFIRKVIFAGFEWDKPSGASRHTIGHGVVEERDISAKSVILALLTVHHLLFTLMTRVDEATPKTTIL